MPKKYAYLRPWYVLLDAVLEGPLEVRHNPGERICGERLQLLQNSEQSVVRPLILNIKKYHLQLTTNTDEPEGVGNMFSTPESKSE